MSSPRARCSTSLATGPGLAGRARTTSVDSAPARIEKLEDLQPAAPSTRIGDSLKQLSDETSDLPIGAVVLLSDGDDNAGGISADAISALRARHIPVHTVGFGRERAQHDENQTDNRIRSHDRSPREVNRDRP